MNENTGNWKSSHLCSAFVKANGMASTEMEYDYDGKRSVADPDLCQT